MAPSRFSNGQGQTMVFKSNALRARQVMFLITIISAVLTLQADAAELKVITNPGMKPVFEELAPRFEQATHNKLIIEYGLFAQFKPVIDAGDFDVAINAQDVTDYIRKQGKFSSTVPVDIARIGIGVAIRAGSPHPDIST